MTPVTREGVADVESAVARGVAFLASRQLPSGQFPIEATIHKECSTVQDESPFATTHIVYSLDAVPGRLPKEMIARALGYFQREMSSHGLWRYWNKDAVWGGRKIRPFIPADLDDTASISYLLLRHGVSFPDNRPLILINRNGSGLFYTWMMLRPAATLNARYWWAMLRELTIARLTVFWKTTEAAYRDVDGVVNANALLYLGERPETEAVIVWLLEIVRNGAEATCDKWYRDGFSFYYALSRNCFNGCRRFESAAPEIAARIRNRSAASGQIGENALHTALAINTLLNFRRDSDADLVGRAVGYLSSTQAADGSWPSAPYYYGGPQKAVSWGSAELTTGLCLEALARCVRLHDGPGNSDRSQ